MDKLAKKKSSTPNIRIIISTPSVNLDDEDLDLWNLSQLSETHNNNNNNKQNKEIDSEECNEDDFEDNNEVYNDDEEIEGDLSADDENDLQIVETKKTKNNATKKSITIKNTTTQI